MITFSHGNTQVVLKPVLRLSGLVVVLPARAERSSKLVLVVSEPLNQEIYAKFHKFMLWVMRSCPASSVTKMTI